MNETLNFFNFQAELYDAYQVACVPHYQEMIRVATTFLDHVCKETRSIRILELGCGTGNATLALRKLFPESQITCLDGSEQMVRLARTKLGAEPVSDIEVRIADLEQTGWSRQWPDDTFDAVISVLVLEHLPFDAYRSVLDEARRILRPGGWLVTVEGYKGEINQELFFKEMADWEERAMRDGHVTRDQLHEIRELSAQKERHYFSSMADKTQWWTEAGFSEVNSIWQYYCVGILVGRNTATSSNL